VLEGYPGATLLPAGDVTGWAEALRRQCASAGPPPPAAAGAAAAEANRRHDSRTMAAHWLALLERC
jgi:hypothetical protein